MTLHDLTEEYVNLLNLAEDADVDDQIFFDTMDGIVGEIEYKFDGYGKVISQMTHDAIAIKKEEDRLSARRKAIENRITNMKNHLMDTMSILGEKKIKTPLFSFGIQKNPAKVVITDESRVAHDFWIPQPAKIDLKRIKTCLDEGFEFDWAHLEQSESLRIR